MICPFVTSCAIPLPAVYRINVATIGWIPRFATRNPLNAPQRPATMIAAIMANAMEFISVSVDTCPPDNIWQHTEAATAITAPTLISCPPDAAVTKVIPIATITSSEARLTTSTRYPYRTPPFMDITKKSGVLITFTKSTTSRQTIGKNK